MDIIQQLQNRSGSKCELCDAKSHLEPHIVAPKDGKSLEDYIFACQICLDQISNTTAMSANHWQCLTTSMWSEVAPVKVIAWRLLNNLSQETWASEALEMIYLEDDILAWAKNGFTINDNDENKVIHKDSNGTILQAGDTVSLTKSLDVKGTTFTAKRGTAVRNISLVVNNAEQIEGRVNGQKIIILTKFVKKS